GPGGNGGQRHARHPQAANACRSDRARQGEQEVIVQLLAEAALRSLMLGATVGLILKLLRVRNPHMLMTAWTFLLIASLSMPVSTGRWLLTVPAGSLPADLIDAIGAKLSMLREVPLGGEGVALAPEGQDSVHPLPDAITAASDHWSSIHWWAFVTCLYAFV